MSAGLAVGVGCRMGATGESIAALVRDTLQGCAGTAATLFTHQEKAQAANVREAAERLAMTLVGLSTERLLEQTPNLVRASEAARRRFGVQSVAEAAALAGAGPGATLLAFAAAAAVLASELTAPTVAQSLVLTRTPGRASSMPERETLEAFAATGATLAIHLSIHKLNEVAAALIPFYGAACPAAVVARASWPDERLIRAPLGAIVQAVGAETIERTGLILVGPALGDALTRESALYSADYVRRHRGGA